MGELLLCSRMPAALPYFIDSASLHVYSLEELSYYIGTNLYLLEEDFMSEELCAWIERELHARELAARLRKIYRENGTLSEFAGCILEESGYHGRKEAERMIGVLRDMEQKSECECRKLRADRCLENRRYVRAVYEYRRLLDESGDEDAALLGNIWHNLGTACARLFLFEDAAACYTEAYEKNRNPESLRECLLAYCCMRDEVRFGQTADAAGLTAEERRAVRETFDRAGRSEAIAEFEAQADTWTQPGGKSAELLEEWKAAYRKNCRI